MPLEMPYAPLRHGVLSLTPGPALLLLAARSRRPGRPLLDEAVAGLCVCECSVRPRPWLLP